MGVSVRCFGKLMPQKEDEQHILWINRIWISAASMDILQLKKSDNRNNSNIFS